MIRSARRRFPSSDQGLSFRIGDARNLDSREVLAIVYSSVLHEVYSNCGKSLDSVIRVLRHAGSALTSGGRVIIREFIRPRNSLRPVYLQHRRTDIVEGHDFVSFSRAKGESDVADDSDRNSHYARYRTTLGEAMEYASKKDFHELWSQESQETYGFWDVPTIGQVMAAAGLRIVYFQLLSCQWRSAHRLQGKIFISDLQHQPLKWPTEKMLLVAERQDRSTSCSASNRALDPLKWNPSGQRVLSL